MHALVLLGPTASGKTAAALELGERLGGEVISVDSRQVYRGMDVGTAKPAAEERARVPHHLIDRVNPDEIYSAGRFRDEALDAIREIGSRGRVPMLVGGTGLYFDALLRGFARVPARDEALRAALERRADEEGTGALHEELRAADPDSAGRIHPNDRIRLVRALEILRLTGRRPSELRGWKSETENASLVGLWWERQALYDRIEERLRRMMKSGLFEEVERLRSAGYGPASPGFRTPGYRELLRCLEGTLTAEQAFEDTARATRRLARRQIQWFRARPRVRWVDGTLPLKVLCDTVMELWKGPSGAAGSH